MRSLPAVVMMGDVIPAPSSLELPVGGLVLELAEHLGEPATAALACELLRGADPAAYEQEIVYLTGHPDPYDGWGDHWPRVWGARALLHVWDESAGSAVLEGLRDPAWRVAEMCLKVATKRGLTGDGAGDLAADLADHRLPRVRGQAMRLLAEAGDTEHLSAVRVALDDAEEGVRRHAARALDRMEIRLDVVDR